MLMNIRQTKDIRQSYKTNLPYSNSALATASLFDRLSSVSVPLPRRRSSCKQYARTLTFNAVSSHGQKCYDCFTSVQVICKCQHSGW